MRIPVYDTSEPEDLNSNHLENPLIPLVSDHDYTNPCGVILDAVNEIWSMSSVTNEEQKHASDIDVLMPEVNFALLGDMIHKSAGLQIGHSNNVKKSLMSAVKWLVNNVRSLMLKFGSLTR